MVRRGWGRDRDGVVVVVWLLLCRIREGGSGKIELGGGDVVVEEHQIHPHLSWVLFCM